MAEIGILDDYQGVALSMADWSLLRRNHRITIFRDNLPFGRELIERLHPFEIIVAMRERTPFPAALLTSLPNLRLLVTTGMWNRAIDLEAARATGVLVCGTDTSVHAPVEHTWALILGLARNIAAEHSVMRTGGWQTGIGCELHGKTLGVLGLGRLGREVANIGKAFGMNVVAWSQNLDPARCAPAGVTYSEKDTFFASADFLTIHVVLGERTRHMIDYPQFALMKPTAFLINTSRGPVVNESALLEALAASKIAGAALDVYDNEPLPSDHPLRQAPHTLLTPHIGITTDANYHLYYRQALEDILAFTNGARLRALNF